MARTHYACAVHAIVTRGGYENKMADLTDQTIDDKVVLIGHAGVGKSSLFTRFKDPSKFVEGEDVPITAQEAQHQKKFANGSSVSGRVK